MANSSKISLSKRRRRTNKAKNIRNSLLRHYQLKREKIDANGLAEENKKHSDTINLCEPSTSGGMTKNITSEVASDEYNFLWGSQKEYNSIKAHRLTIEVEQRRTKVSGHRIVEIDYFLEKTLRIQTDHNRKCTGGRLEVINEKRNGLVSTFILKCNVCDKEIELPTENPEKKSVITESAVWGTLATGSTYGHLTEMLSVLDIPHMRSNTFFEIQRGLGYLWKECLWQSMESAGAEEQRLAIENGDVDKDGIAVITVYLDGGWSKRSYGHSFNAASGVAVIIGKRTGKLLFLGVRNKYCSICARAENRQENSPDHICFKNWSGPSTSMEADIIVEGFNRSIDMHNVRYKKFIADGDSTVFAKIKANVQYGTEVTKIECTNHCIKNYSKHLYNIKKDTKGVALSARKMLTKQKIDSLTSFAQRCIYANAHGDILTLKEDIRNSINHVFGCHQNCKTYLCENVGDTDNAAMNLVKQSGAYHHIYGALALLLNKCHQLIDNETNNRAELFMSILARFNMGKRLNLVQRDSFQTRAFLTGLRYNGGHSWHNDVWKTKFDRSPGKHLKHYMQAQGRRAKSRKIYRKPKVVKQLKFDNNCSTIGKDYGTNIAATDISEEDLQEEVGKLLEVLQVSDEEQRRIAKETVGQFSNPVYISQRMHRLTASNFGEVVRRRPKTPCNALVKRLLNQSNFSTPAMDYGKINETVAIKKFEDKTGLQVHASGIYISTEYGFLAASPDGIIGDSDLVEVKCLFKVASSQKTLKECVKNKQVQCLTIDKEEKIHLKINHSYYYQIQGQLHITNRERCYFIVYSGDKNELFIEEIKRDKHFWKTVMLPKLIAFYKECLAPEIILNRRGRNLECVRHPVPGTSSDNV